jgi:formamidopyrimidine-DNA glycosylase
MPELPDVEIFKRYMDTTSLHLEIGDISVNSTKVLKSISAKRLKSQLRKRSFEPTRRYGKYLFAQTDKDLWLVLHFGMTDYLKYYKRESRDIEYIRILFSFNNGYHLAYISQRMPGNVSLAPSVEKFIEKLKYGPDAFETNYETFRSAVKKSRGALKSTLMNQKIITSGRSLRN